MKRPFLLFVLFATACGSSSSDPATEGDDLTAKPKVIACTGPAVDAKITLARTRGSITITRQAGADRHDPPNGTVSLDKTPGSEVPGYVYFESAESYVDPEFYVNLTEDDYAKKTGIIHPNLRWAENGEEFFIGTTSCAYVTP